MPASIALASLLASLAGACGPAEGPARESLASAPASVVSETPTEVRPGATDPARAWAKWADDELFATSPVLAADGMARFSVFEPSADLTALTELEHSSFTAAQQPDAIFAAKGHILSSEHESIVYAHRSGSDVVVKFFRPSTPTPIATLANLAPRATGSTDFLDIAVGDLDGYPTARDYDYAEEVAVAYAKPGGSVDVVVLSFGQSTESSPAPTAITTTYPRCGINTAVIGTTYSTNMYPTGDKIIALTTGDFNGDGVKEIALACLNDNTGLEIALYRYSVTLDPTKNWAEVTRSLQHVGSGSVEMNGWGVFWNATISLAAGDFDGDGKDELAVGTVDRTFGAGYTVRSRLFSIVSDPTAYCGSGTPCYRATEVSNTAVYGSGAGTGYQVRLAAGLFKFDPTNGWGPNRRQLAVAHTALGNVNVRTIEYATDRTATSSPAVSIAGGGAAPFALATGGFKGDRSPSDPLDSLAVSTWVGQSYTVNLLHPAAGAAPTLTGQLVRTTSATTPNTTARLPLLPIDTDGNSFFLGAPIHITIMDAVATDALIEEPPKHTYWDPLAVRRDGTLGRVINLSRYDDFYVELKSQSGVELSNSNTDTTDWSIGGSLALSAAATAEGHANVGIAKVSAEATLEASGKISYDYDKTSKQISTSYSQQEFTLAGQTTGGDLYLGRTLTYDIWRYRVYGLNAKDEAGNPINPFFDIVVPEAQVLSTGPAEASQFDWYQPVHENGNILTYPKYSAATTGHPPDLGSFQIADSACTGCTKTVQQPLVEPFLLFWDADFGNKGLTFSSGSGGSTERSVKHTLAENASIKGSAKTTVGVGGKALGGSMSLTTSAEAEFHNKNSWGAMSTTEKKTSRTTGISLNKPANPDPGTSYAFYTLFYVTTDGTLTATHAVDALGGAGSGWWRNQYGQQPDLALNLPNRYAECTTFTNADCPTSTGPAAFFPRVADDRKQIRGFFLKSATANGLTGEFDMLKEAPKDGTPVRIEVRVYNQSVTQFAPTGAKVRFVAVPYIWDTNKENADPATHKLIGETTLGALAPQAMVIASITWDTAGFGPVTCPSADCYAQYRIYVELDPPDATHPNGLVAEKYETESGPDPATGDFTTVYGNRIYCRGPDSETNNVKICINPGQNNVGYGYATVAKALAGDPRWGRPQSHVSMVKDGIAAIDPRGKLVTRNVQALFGQELRIRVAINSDTPSAEFSDVLVYDGHPNSGGKLIASKRVFSGASESGVWLRWTPVDRGPHRLFAKVLQSVHDPSPGDNIAELKVEVIPPPHAPEQVR